LDRKKTKKETQGVGVWLDQLWEDLWWGPKIERIEKIKFVWIPYVATGINMKNDLGRKVFTVLMEE